MPAPLLQHLARLLRASLPLGAIVAAGTPAEAAEKPTVAADEQGFARVARPGAVDIRAEYDLTGLSIPEGEIHALLPRDAIPALTDPKREPANEATWLADDARIIVVMIGDESLGVPLAVLDWHEVANVSVGGEPVAVTYCPLCDSAVVFSRRVRQRLAGGATQDIVLEFGVSGALYNSNVLLYDRKHRGLWSQLAMQAVSGPLVGTELDVLPVDVMTLRAYREARRAAGRAARIVSRPTGHERPYDKSPYAEYFGHDELLVPVASAGTALPRKTLGVGISSAESSWFVPASAIGPSFTLTTPAGDVRMASTDAGIRILAAPEGVRTAQSLYYSWSAFHPDTKVVAAAPVPASRPAPRP